MKINTEELSIRELKTEDIGLLLVLQNEVLSENTANRETLRENTYDDFAACFNERSLALGVFHNGLLIGYGILYYAGEDHENLAYCLDTPGNVYDYANIKVIVVKNTYRGNGLQSLLIRRFEQFAAETDIKALLCTVSPKNAYSNRNFQNNGYRLVKTVRKYGNLERYLYIKYM